MRRLVLLACLLLTACAPVIVTVPAGGELLPEQIQRAADAYTATARVQATQAAGATATGISARETATAASQGTLSALVAEQTSVALQLTSAAGMAAATDAAGIKTQAARQTAAWATPTAAAIRTQAAATAEELRRQQASADSVAQFWSLLRWVILASIAGLVIVACVLILVRGLAYVITEAMRAKAAIAREAFKVLAGGYWAEWLPGYGYSVQRLPGPLDAPPTVIENAVATPNRLRAWSHAARLFAWWGDRYGFGIRDMMNAGVISDPAWRELSKLLKDAGVLAEVRQPGKRGTVTAWAPEWDYRRLAHELDKGGTALPFPADADPPKVAFAVPTQHHN